MSPLKYLVRALIFWAGLATIIWFFPPESLFAVTAFFILLPLALLSSLVYPIGTITGRFRRRKNPKVSRRRAWILSIGITLLALTRFIRLDTWFNTTIIILLMLLMEIYLNSMSDIE